jgi:hypothetical protein
MWNNKWGVGNSNMEEKQARSQAKEQQYGVAKQLGSHAREQQARSNDLEK